MIDVDDFGKVVRPVRAAIDLIVPPPPRRPLASGEQGREGREHVAAVKRVGEELRPPLDFEGAGLLRATPDDLEQAVARADIPAAVGFDHEHRTLSADAGIDDAQEHGSLGKPRGMGGQKIGRRPGIAGRRVGEQVDDGDALRQIVQHRLHLARIGPVQPEIREKRNHGLVRSLSFAALL